MEKTETDELRRVMGTLPDKQQEQSKHMHTKLSKGASAVTVELVDWSVNPYKAMYIMATSCWGTKINKWKETRPEHRFLVVKKSCIDHCGLPLPLEAPKFTFVVEGLSRAAFDQIARSRIGVCFSAKGMRDNNWSDCDFIVPTELADRMESDPGLAADYEEWTETTKKLYTNICSNGRGSWQTARSVLPLYVKYGFSMTINYASLVNFCSRRMKFCEMEDTCATAWLLRHELNKRFPLLASGLRPSCDVAGKCQYHDTYKMSELFGCLFKECGRNPCNSTNDYAEFNTACTDINELRQQLNIDIPDSCRAQTFDEYSELTEKDKKLFEAD